MVMTVRRTDLNFMDEIKRECLKVLLSLYKTANAGHIKSIPLQEGYRIGFYLGANDSKGNQSSMIVDAVSIPDVLDYYHKLYGETAPQKVQEYTFSGLKKQVRNILKSKPAEKTGV
jgi:hypothetical protein